MTTRAQAKRDILAILKDNGIDGPFYENVAHEIAHNLFSDEIDTPSDDEVRVAVRTHKNLSLATDEARMRAALIAARKVRQ